MYIYVYKYIPLLHTPEGRKHTRHVSLATPNEINVMFFCAGDGEALHVMPAGGHYM